MGRRWKAFLTSFICTLLIILFAAGLNEVDYQCRQIGFGDENTLLYRLTGKHLRFNGELLDELLVYLI
ncbi:hypothetical protein [Hydrogeniiclostridium mannosilyticum]|uniref:Uncharacterized protein n=1 Tax=Hydrogeniiclostridium mannosilyticum TaxID=2764322 RepID=A0A328UFW9_9FIRM|nr:hypothetical protein [Hydrogeniiclostridium mannosilyticum]RAQ30737.1 hypothetical protein DPQ25_04450 [Hydrogeniiclostridium mannosilyticum]